MTIIGSYDSNEYAKLLVRFHQMDQLLRLDFSLLSLETIMDISYLELSDSQLCTILQDIDKQKMSSLMASLTFRACKNGYVECLGYLVKIPTFGHLKALSTVLSTQLANQWKCIEILLSEIAISGELARMAIQSNHMQLARYLLEKNKGIWNTSPDFWLPCSRGNTELVSLLLETNADPSANNNHAIRCASEMGHCDIVELLVQDPRVDPSDFDNSAVKLAQTNGHTQIVNLLLKQPNVSLSKNKKYYFF
ncbi:hypothetical protein HDV01_001679 [Terramyces sp. JEL0728]|nr:hypothetical protein HDV01_001679 [Terramyces sp. JEL0728]